MKTIGAFLLPLLGLTASCGGTCHREALGQPVLSPDGRYAAQILRANCGVTDPFTFLVTISDAKSDPPEVAIVFTSIRAAPTVKWRSRTDLTLGVGGALPRHMRTKWKDISVVAAVALDPDGQPLSGCIGYRN